MSNENSALTIDEIKDARKVLTNSLRNQILEFERLTGTVVERITIERLNTRAVGGPEESILNSVEIDVRVP